MSQCRGCGAQIIWAITEKNGKKVPLDAKPERRYIVQSRLSSTDSREQTPLVRILETYMPHFATCPKAGNFRKERKRENTET